MLVTSKFLRCRFLSTFLLWKFSQYHWLIFLIFFLVAVCLRFYVTCWMMLVRYVRHFTSSWFSEKCNNLQIQINNESTIKSGYWSCWRACTFISTNHYFSQKYTNCNQTYSRFRWCLMKVTKILGIFLERLSFYHPKNSTDKEIKVIFKRWNMLYSKLF